MRTLVEYLPEHPFFAGLDPAAMELVVGCAQNVHFKRRRRAVPHRRAGRTRST